MYDDFVHMINKYFLIGADLKSSMENKLTEAGISNQGNRAEHMATYILHSRADNTVRNIMVILSSLKLFVNLRDQLKT